MEIIDGRNLFQGVLRAFCRPRESSRTPIIALTLSAYGNDGNYLENQAVNRHASVTNFKKALL